MKWYGSVVNRIEEGRQLVDEIKVGTDITMYYWSDRTCYYVTEVESQKRIKVRRYIVVADRDKVGGVGHQNWVYFKTRKEYCEYMSQYFPGKYEYDGREDDPETWVFRNGTWKEEYFCRDLTPRNKTEERQLEKLGYIKRYCKLSGKISIGKRDYYYDWEF